VSPTPAHSSGIVQRKSWKVSPAAERFEACLRNSCVADAWRITVCPTASRPVRVTAPATLFFGKSSSSFDFQFLTLKWVSLTPFPATLTSTLQITEKPASLSPAFATLTSRVKHKSCVCHSYAKHPGWRVPFSPNLRTIKRGEEAPIFLATRHAPLATSSVPLNLLKSTRIQPPATIASKELTPKLNLLDATLTKKQGEGPLARGSLATRLPAVAGHSPLLSFCDTRRGTESMHPKCLEVVGGSECYSVGESACWRS
jgi:hypothetical protein